MKRRTALLITAALAFLGLVGSVIWLLSPSGDPGESASLSETASIQPNGPVAAVYFPGTSGKLEPEARPAPPGLDRSGRNLWLAEQVAAGPDTTGLEAALPADTEVTSVFAAPDGTIFIDLSIPRETMGMGSTDELLALYSLVNTLLLDNEDSDRVVILINGRQRETLAGHVDTSGPLAARTDFIRTPG